MRSEGLSNERLLMASSNTEICNLAISHLGSTDEIDDLETDSTPEAAACQRYYEQARAQVLRDFPWPFATKFRTLDLIEEEPTDEWGYSYRYPSDCLILRRILSGSRNDARQTRVAYRIAKDDDGKLLYTDMEEALAEYTEDMTDVTLFPPDFVMALSFRLASYIAPRLIAGDPFKLGDRAVKYYFAEIASARAQALNEEQPDEEPLSEFERARD